jgi:hypothetical protein
MRETLRPILKTLPLLILVFAHTSAGADDLALFYGAGPQPGSDQRNSLAGVEYTFYSFERSSRQHIQVGVSYATWRTGAGSSHTVHAVSVYPQLTFYSGRTSKIVNAMPEGVLPFFFMRMLGPMYISEKSLGLRNQARHFSFHAQHGAGLLFETKWSAKGFAHFSWRHISNANLFSPNDGIDVPFVVTVGFRH